MVPVRFLHVANEARPDTTLGLYATPILGEVSMEHYILEACFEWSQLIDCKSTFTALVTALLFSTVQYYSIPDGLFLLSIIGVFANQERSPKYTFWRY